MAFSRLYSCSWAKSGGGGQYCTFGQTKAKAMKAKVKMLCRKSWLGGSRSHCRMVTYENGKQFDLQCGWRWLVLCVNAGMQVCVDVCVQVCVCDHQFWLPPSTVAMPIRGINNAKCQITSKGSVGQGNRSRRKKKRVRKGEWCCSSSCNLKLAAAFVSVGVFTRTASSVA